jgi:hypothetical protein
MVANTAMSYKLGFYWVYGLPYCNTTGHLPFGYVTGEHQYIYT